MVIYSASGFRAFWPGENASEPASCISLTTMQHESLIKGYTEKQPHPCLKLIRLEEAETAKGYTEKQPRPCSGLFWLEEAKIASLSRFCRVPSASGELAR